MYHNDQFYTSPNPNDQFSIKKKKSPQQNEIKLVKKKVDKYHAHEEHLHFVISNQNVNIQSLSRLKKKEKKAQTIGLLHTKN